MTARAWVRVALVGAAIAAAPAPHAAAGGAPSPKEVLGLDVGTDRVLASYSETEKYLRALAQRASQVRLLEMGKTVEGRSMLAVAVSSAANIARLEELRRAWARVADPRGLTVAERDRLVATLPSCALITAGIHANEVAGPQTVLLLAHELAGAEPGSVEAAWLDHTVVLLVPSLNPDGQEATVAWYRKWLGTPFEGSSPPFLFHRYAGHDNNRDFVYLTQPESRALNSFAYRDWHPQLFLDLHMMGSTGPRQFVPPFADPIAPNVHPFVWRMTANLGTLMSLRLEEAGKAGVISGWTFDGNWIGGTRNTGWWKNVFGVLTETAGAALATPVHVDENELRGGGKGLVDYRAQVNFPNPWRGGRWGLADAVSYQLTLVRAFVEFASVQRASLLRDVAQMAAEAVTRGERDAPRAFLVPPGGDPGRRAHLVRLLLMAGLEGFAADEELIADGTRYPGGTVVFFTAQPLRQYLLEVMSRQHYPQISPAPHAEILLPYDVTAWTMPLELGVPVVKADEEVRGRLAPLGEQWAGQDTVPAGNGGVLIVPADQLGGFAVADRALARGARVARITESTSAEGRHLGAGSFVISGLGAGAAGEILAGAGVAAVRAAEVPVRVAPLRRAAVGVFHPNFPLEDAGWLRFALENAGFPVTVVDTPAMASGGFATRVEVLVIPPMDGKVLVDGRPQRGPAPLPPEYRGGIGRDGTEALKRFVASGGTVIAFGPSADWLADALELPVTDPLQGTAGDDMDCPGALLALDVDTTSPIGWMRGEEKLRRRAAVVEVRKGAGRAVLFSFAPYFRGQTEATLPLLYNAVVEKMMESQPAPKPAARAPDTP